MVRRIGSSNSDEEGAPELNLTPLIDVVFVVLICFILLAPMVEIDQVKLADAPKARTESASVSASPASVHVLEDDSILIGQRHITLNTLENECLLLKRNYPDATPQLFHDRKATFGTYQAIKNALEAAGFHAIDVILQPS